MQVSAVITINITIRGKDMQKLFSARSLKADKVGFDVGYWYRDIKKQTRQYRVSITRDGEDIYTVSSILGMEHSPDVYIAGHVAGLEAAAKLANETIEHLQKHDLYISIRNNNGAGDKVLVSK